MSGVEFGDTIPADEIAAAASIFAVHASSLDAFSVDVREVDLTWDELAIEECGGRTSDPDLP